MKGWHPAIIAYEGLIAQQKVRSQSFWSWGKHDALFDIGEPGRYRQDVTNAQVYVLDAGHFALDTKADEIAGLVQEFMKMQSKRRH